MSFTVSTCKKSEFWPKLAYYYIWENILEVKTVAGKDKPAKEISFNANYFKEILTRNRNVTGAVLKVNTAGISNINFKTTEYEANYYLLKTAKS